MTNKTAGNNPVIKEPLGAALSSKSGPNLYTYMKKLSRCLNNKIAVKPNGLFIQVNAVELHRRVFLAPTYNQNNRSIFLRATIVKVKLIPKQLMLIKLF